MIHALRSVAVKATGAIAGTAMLALLPATAHAASADGAAATRPSFAAQARGAGLTATQEAGLQAKVDGFLAKTGGTQIAANEIEIKGQGVLVVAVPGDKYAKDLSTPGTVHPDYTCQYLHFCAYSDTGGAGSVMDWFYCGTYYMPWDTVGSFDDNQSPGTVSTFYLTDNTNFNVTAIIDDPDIDWMPVYNITVC